MGQRYSNRVTRPHIYKGHGHDKGGTTQAGSGGRCSNSSIQRLYLHSDAIFGSQIFQYVYLSTRVLFGLTRAYAERFLQHFLCTLSLPMLQHRHEGPSSKCNEEGLIVGDQLMRVLVDSTDRGSYEINRCLCRVVNCFQTVRWWV